MDEAAAALRALYSREGTWTGERVRAALRAAWKAYGRGKKTEEHTGIMAWPPALLGGPNDSDLRIALHYMGLAESGDYDLPELIRHRIGCSRSTYEARIREGSDAIAGVLNRDGKRRLTRAGRPQAALDASIPRA